MGSTLTNTQPKDTYKSLLKTSDSTELSGTAKYVSDGNGNDSALALSTGNIGIGTTSPAEKLHIEGGNIKSSNSGNTISTNLSNDGVYASGTDLYLLAPAGKFLALYAGNTERLRVLADGGLTFNGDTSANNALSDYEIGTWTGTLTPSTSGSITVSAGTQPFGYTKIGRQVTVSGLAVVSSVSSPVGLRIRLGNLPFTVANSTAARAGGAVTFFDSSASYAFTAVNGYVEPNLTYVLINFDSSTLGANDEFAFTFTYFV